MTASPPRFRRLRTVAAERAALWMVSAIARGSVLFDRVEQLRSDMRRR